MLQKLAPQQLGLPLYRWYAGYDLLFAAYVALFGVLFFTDSLPAARWVFLGLVLPLAVLPQLTFASSLSADAIRQAAWASARRLGGGVLAGGRSVIFWGAALYLAALLLSAALQPDASPRLVRRHAIHAIEILAFLLITAFLVVAYRHFLTRFFTAMAVLVAASALMNAAIFVAITPVPAGLGDYRLTPATGMYLDRGATTVSLVYALFLIGAVAVGLRPGLSRAHRLVLLASSAILVLAIIWTQTRGTYLALLVVLAFVAARASRKVRWMLLGGLAIVVLAGVVVPDVREALMLRGGSYRLEAWRTFFAMAGEHPFLGRGALANLSIKMANGVPAEHPHNLLLSAWILGGALAAAAMLLMILGGLYWSAEYDRRYGRMAPLCVMLIVSVTGVFDYLVRITPPGSFWIAFWLPVGLCVGCETAVRTLRAHGARNSNIMPATSIRAQGRERSGAQ